MAWNDPTSLKFDLDKIREMRSELQLISTELSSLSSTLTTDIEALMQNWKTDAGKAFKDKYDDGWKTEVEKYLTIVDAIDQLLAEAETAYAEVETAAEALKF